ncbi:MAG: class I SAM-dependent methyltransferase [Pirellulales bacterium]|nr:class I SAM-dependent methyltransferase [Pirellulales bacterium]
MPIIEGIPQFLPVDDDPHWREQQKLRALEIRASRDCDFDRSSMLRKLARQLERRLASHLKIMPDSRIVQVGVREEGIIHHLRGGICYAVDPLAGEMAAAETLRIGRVRWVAARGEELPFVDRSVDLILLDETLAHAESPQAVLRAASRCLKDTGLLLLTCPIEPSPTLSLLHQLASGMRHAARLVRGRVALHSFTARALVRLTRLAGFRRTKSWWGHRRRDGLFHLEEGRFLSSLRGGFGVMLAQPQRSPTPRLLRFGRRPTRTATPRRLESRAA